MYAELAWVLVSSVTHVQPQIILNSDDLLDYFFNSYDYDTINLLCNCDLDIESIGHFHLYCPNLSIKNALS